VRAEYDQLRVRLARVLRQLEEARSETVDPGAVLSLDDIKLELAEVDTTVNGKLEGWIRDRVLSPSEATSLMNDAGYAYDITKNLVRMGEVLFAVGDLEERETERSLALDLDELEDGAADPRGGGAR